MEADFGMTQQAMQNQNRFAADGNLLVKFFMHPKLQRKESETAGRPIYRDTEYIQIMTPGNKDSIIQRPARAMDRDRFPKHYEKFKARESQQVEGTLLAEWPGLTRGQVEEMKWLNILTVEQLANVSDQHAQNVMGISMLKKKAQKYLETAEANATQAKFDALEAKYQALLARFDEKQHPVEVQEAAEPAEADTPPKRRARRAAKE